MEWIAANGLAPLASPFLSLFTAVFLIPFARRARSTWSTASRLFIPASLFIIAYHWCLTVPLVARWLKAVESPIWAAFLLVVLPAMHLPRNRLYRWFLLVPAAFVLLFAASVYAAYRTVPATASGFYWILVRPGWFVAGLVSALALVRQLLSMTAFRRLVRAACFLVLITGGFTLRQNYEDYRAMSSRRATRRDVMNLSETSPVLGQDGRLVHLPSAPCRFTKDGGYIQGCNLELIQRLLQLNFSKIAERNTGELGAMEAILASFLAFTVLSFLVARWMCGWLCPLSTMGEALNAVRRRLGRIPFRPGRTMQQTFLGSGLAVSGIALVMARMVPSLDAAGRVAGCRIPLFPFCKLCPNQQLCPVVAGGLAAYPPLPGMEWAFGFFRYGCLIILGLYVICFATARRLWCRFCPMGMLSGLFNRGGSFMLRKDPVRCNGCGMCAETCPMHIGRVRDEMQEQNVSTYDCVLCLRCVQICPRDGCLSLEHEGHAVVRSKGI